jgi:hypothetical protein
VTTFRRANRPAFGVVGAPSGPAAPAAPAAAAPRVDLVVYGFSDNIDATRPGPTPMLDEIRRLAAAADWRSIAGLLHALPRSADIRIEAIDKLGELAAENDDWLREWLAAGPHDVTALSVYGSSLVHLAWQIRTTKMPEHISADQWEAFFRVLRQAPDVCNRGAKLDPRDPAPLAVLLTAAKGLQWPQDEYRALYAELMRRAPGSFIANTWAKSYWLPRWFGSKELLSEYVEAAIAAAPPGSLLTAMRIDALCFELRPEDPAQRPAFYRGQQFGAALDAALADLAAADAAHPMLPHLRHWLAYGLYQADRSAEALIQFQAIGDYCGIRPWTEAADAREFFARSRIGAIQEYEAAARSGPPTA